MAAYRLLGDVEASVERAPLALGGAGQRATLAILLMTPNRFVSDDRLVAGVATDQPGSLASLRTFVSSLRRAIGPIIERRGTGYAIIVDEAEIDLSRFRLLVSRAREAHDSLKLAAASELLNAAQALWRSPALGGLERTTFYRDIGPALAEERAAATDLRFAVELALGHHERCLSDLWSAAADEPLRERRWGQLMLALYRSGQQAEALRAYSLLRSRMADELGLDPGPELKRLESDVLTANSGLDWRESPERPTDRGDLRPRRDFTCRREELLRLREFALVGGGAAIVRGEAGMGKSVLVSDFVDAMRAQGAFVLTASCRPGTRAPFDVIREALDGIHDLALASDVEILDLGIVLPGIGGTLAETSEAFLPASQERVLAAAVALLCRAAEATPQMILVIEDVQWADTSTMAFVNSILRSSAPVLVVLSSRGDIEGFAVFPEVEIRLRALSVEETCDLWAGLTGTRPEPKQSEKILAITGGIPFYIAVHARSRTGSWREDLESTALVDTSRSQGTILNQRLSGLGERVAALLEGIAIAGPPVRAYELSTMLGLDAATLVEMLQPAVDAGVLIVESPTRLEYHFAHDLIRDHVASAISAPRAAVLHAAAAAAITGDETSQALLRRWRHLTRAAGLVSHAELLEAARSAFFALERAGAVDQAEEVCATTLTLTGDAHETAAEMLVRLAVLLGRAGRHGDARVALDRGATAARAGGAYHILIEVMRASDPFDQALSGDPHRAATVREALGLLGDSPTSTRLSGLVALSVAEHRQGRSASARVLLDEAESCAAALDTPAAKGMVAHLRHLLERSSTTERPDVAKRSRATSLSIEQAIRSGDLALIIATSADALTDALEFGTYGQAQSALDTLSAYAGHASSPMPRWAAACAAVVLAQAVGELDRAEDLAARAMAIGRENALGLADVAFDAHRLVDGILRGDFSRLITSLAVAAGRDADAPAWMFAAALARARSGDLVGSRRIIDSTGGVARLPDDWLRPAGLVLAGEATALAGGPDDPRAIIDCLQPWAGGDLVVGSAMVSLGPVQRVTGLLYAAMGHHDDAATELIEAAERCSRRGMPAWARLALTDALPLARLAKNPDLIERANVLSTHLSQHSSQPAKDR